MNSVALNTLVCAVWRPYSHIPTANNVGVKLQGHCMRSAVVETAKCGLDAFKGRFSCRRLDNILAQT